MSDKSLVKLKTCNMATPLLSGLWCDQIVLVHYKKQQKQPWRGAERENLLITTRVNDTANRFNVYLFVFIAINIAQLEKR